jgi:hypothetical protein
MNSKMVHNLASTQMFKQTQGYLGPTTDSQSCFI